MAMQRGLLITFEGIDGCGKTTQVRLLIENLKRHELEYCLFREPGGTDIGEKIRTILLDKDHIKMLPPTEILLYSASRYQLTAESIRPALQQNKVVLCDRFFDSTTAYQGYGRSIDLDFVEQLNRFATEELIPDLTFILDISEAERRRRIHTKDLDRLERENQDFQERVREGFLILAKRNPARIIVLDGNQSAEALSKEIWAQFQKKYQES